jgi:DNA repair protein RadC
MKKPTNQVRQNRSAALPPQAKTKTPAVPGEFKIVRMRDCPVDSPKIETPTEVVDFWRKHVVTAPWFKDDKECLCVFLLNTRRRLIGFELVSQGTLDTILMHPREVLRPAAIHNAAAIIIAHNHPSGDPGPSEGDIKATRDLIRAAEDLKIELLDHIIIGDARRKKSFTSLRGLGCFCDDDPAPVPESAAASASNISPKVLIPSQVAKKAEAALLKLRSPQLWEALSDIDEAKNEVVHLLQFIDGGDLNSMIGRMADRLCLASDNAFRALRGEPAAQ